MTLESVTASEKLIAAAQQEYKILAEYKILQSEDIAGIYVIPSAESTFLWFGIIFVRDGIYKDGIFRFTISLPEKFPESTISPTITFQSEIFHPSICAFSGTLELMAFQNWQPCVNHVWQLLKYIQFIFQYPNHNIKAASNKLLNKSAADLLSQNKAEFILKVKENVRVSRDLIYEPAPTDDKHYIVFERFDTDVHGPILESIKNRVDISLTSQSSGISWLKETALKTSTK